MKDFLINCLLIIIAGFIACKLFYGVINFFGSMQDIKETKHVKIVSKEIVGYRYGNNLTVVTDENVYDYIDGNTYAKIKVGDCYRLEIAKDENYNKWTKEKCGVN